MLNPNNDRLDYGHILSAPQDYELDFAIGTTYSLDLDSLVGASIALGLSQETDTILRKNPIFLLHALQSTGDKIALFCENGRIKSPNKITKLYILLEEMVFQVTNPNVIKGNHASFHPKFWLIRYVNEEEEDVLYRIIVLSRNLTFDKSWDISFSMDGKKLENRSNLKIDKNKNLINFLEYLKDFSTNSEKTDKINEIIMELDDVEFYLNTNTFDDFEFIPYGISKNVSIEKYPSFLENFDDLVIMTPFLSKNVISELNKKVNPCEKEKYDSEWKGPYLFTREDSLSNLNDSDCDKFKIYTLKNQVIGGESTVSGESDYSEEFLPDGVIDEESNGADENISHETQYIENKDKDIHAKIYFVRNGAQVDIYLGSLNTSFNALNGNVEFLVHLKTNYRKFNLKKLLNDLFCGEEGGPDSPFQLVDDINKYVEVGPKEKIKDYLESVLRNIARLKFKSKITSDDNLYKINLSVDNFSDFEEEYKNKDLNISLKPLLYKNSQTFSKNMIFSGLSKNKLSVFFVISIEYQEEHISKIIKIETEGMPDDRDKDIFSEFVKDKTAFINYVSFILGIDSIAPPPVEPIAGWEDEDNGDGSGDDSKKSIQFPAVYEKMLDAVVSPQNKLNEIDYLIQTLPEDVIPEGFIGVYGIFKEVLDDEQ